MLIFLITLLILCCYIVFYFFKIYYGLKQSKLKAQIIREHQEILQKWAKTMAQRNSVPLQSLNYFNLSAECTEQDFKRAFRKAVLNNNTNGNETILREIISNKEICENYLKQKNATR